MTLQVITKDRLQIKIKMKKL